MPRNKPTEQANGLKYLGNVTLQNIVVTIYTPDLTFKNSAFFPQRVYLCVSYDSQNKQRLFP
jgi:hypothetical protein